MSAMGVPFAMVTRSIFTSRSLGSTWRSSAIRRGAFTKSILTSCWVTVAPFSRSVSEKEVTLPSFWVALKSITWVPRPCRM